MKYFAFFVVLVSLAFPVFAQNTAHAQRLNALSESMGNTISRSSATLADFDSQIKENADVKVYTSYVRKYGALSDALDESEYKLKLLLRTNDRNNYVAEERDNYESILNQLQSVKSDFDTYLRSAR
jgi:hypothetical protein